MTIFRVEKKEVTLTESKTAYDLQSSADKINESLDRFENEIWLFFDKFNGVYLELISQ